MKTSTSTSTKTVAYSISQIQQTLLSVDKYPEFIPMCGSVSAIESGDSSKSAIINLKTSFIKIQLQTKMYFVDEHNIKVEMSGGVFKSLNGDWLFTKIDDNSCKVSLITKFSFKNELTDKLLSKFITSGLSSQVLKYFIKGTSLRIGQ